MRTLLPFVFAIAVHSSALALSRSELESIGKRVWQNECGGTVSGLTSWNTGEDFASLGIGHFIWYAENQRGPFEESFPKLAAFLADKGENVPAWMRGACPWKTRTSFLADAKSERMTELRGLLARTIGAQSEFLAQRMREALPKMLKAAPASRRAHIETQFGRLAETASGTYALIDYVNFKGEGTKAEERYNGEGWGLLQVLENMAGTGSATADFAASAARVLSRRVENAPSSRGEQRWLPGWLNRVRAYGK